MNLEENSDSGFDLESAAAGLAEDLGLVEPAEETTEHQPESGDTAPTPPADTAKTPAGAPPNAPPASPASTAPHAPQAGEPPAAPPTGEDVPPDTWKKEAKEQWGTIPEPLRAEIRRREADIAKFVGETKPAVEVAKMAEKVISPYTGLLQQYGLNPWDHMANVLKAHATLVLAPAEQKVAMFKKLAADVGIDVTRLGAEGADAANNPLMQHVQELQTRIRQLESGVTGVTKSVRDAQLAEMEQEVLRFGKDEEKHPFFYEVAEEVTSLLQSGLAKTLEDAYQTAVNANPITRGKLLEREVSARMKKQDEEARAAAEKARKAASTNVRATGKSRAAPAKESIDDTLREALAEINARDS